MAIQGLVLKGVVGQKALDRRATLAMTTAPVIASLEEAWQSRVWFCQKHYEKSTGSPRYARDDHIKLPKRAFVSGCAKSRQAILGIANRSAKA
ncbi:MAG: hypothetical protein PHW66_01705 [Gallionella sp.]|nr:hypothetical protein [Gallionella sp.]